MKEGRQARKKDFQSILTTMMICACLLSVLILGLAQIGLSARVFSGLAYEDLESFLDNVNHKWELRIQYVEKLVMGMHHKEQIMDFLQEELQEEQSYGEAERELKSWADLFSEENTAEGFPFIDNIAVFRKDGKAVSSHYYPGTVEEKEQILAQMQECRRQMEASGELFFYLPEEDHIFLSMWLYDENMQQAGSCVISIGVNAVHALFGALDMYPDSVWQLTGGGNVLIASGGELPPEESREILIGGQHYLQNVWKGSFHMESRTAVRKHVIYASMQSILWPLCLILLVVLGAAGTSVYFLSRHLTRPFQEMGEDMKRFGKRKFDVRMREFRTREFQELSELFNEMADEIQTLITQVYEKELLAARAQMKYLQSQINPHFMFNILTMVSMKAGLKGETELQKILTAFAGLLQGKIFRQGEVLIPLSEEMELTEFYLFLQKERFAGKIAYDISCPEDCMSWRIPRLVIEPLVENAVSHGLEPKEEAGTVWIEIRQDSSGLEILVRDDGVGFDPAGQELEDGRHTHVSLNNTKQLLQTMYGDRACLEVESRPGAGTQVRIRLPREEQV